MTNNNNASRPARLPARKRGKAAGGRYITTSRGSHSSLRNSDSASQRNSDPPQSQLSGDRSAGAHVTTTSNSAQRSADDSCIDGDVRKQLEKLQNNYNEVLVANNDYKQQLNRLKIAEAGNKIAVDVWKEKVSLLNREIAELKMENSGLHKLVHELQSSQKRSGKASSKFWDKIVKTVDPKYHALVKALHDHLSSWCAAESMEIVQGTTRTRRRKWDGRVQKVSEFGLPLLSQYNNSGSATTILCVPFPFAAVFESTELFYVQSFVSHQSILANELKVLLDTPAWNAFNTTEFVQNETIRTISTNSTMLQKVKQFLSETISNRKRNVMDDFFTYLSYFGLRSQHDRRKDTPLFDKEEEIKRAKAKLIQIIDGSEVIDYSLWRTADIEKLSCDGSVPDILTSNDAVIDKSLSLQPVPNNNDGENGDDSAFNCSILGIHRNQISFLLWIRFLGYNPLLNVDNIMDTSFLSITRLDAWIATAVTLLTDRKNRGGGRQRDFSRVFHENFISATYQFVERVYKFVKFWVPGELTIAAEDGVATPDEIKNLHRDATVILYSPHDATYYIAVNSSWFSQYISPNFGIVHDCFIAKFSKEWDSIIPLTAESSDLPDNVPQPATTASASHSTATVRQDFQSDLLTDKPAPEYSDYDDDDRSDSRGAHVELAPDSVPPLP